jgi:hypothetical protein
MLTVGCCTCGVAVGHVERGVFVGARSALGCTSSMDGGACVERWLCM